MPLLRITGPQTYPLGKSEPNDWGPALSYQREREARHEWR